MSSGNDNRAEEDVQRLIEWLQKQPHLPQDIDKRTLKAYVLGTKSLEISKQKLDAYFTWKLKAPYYFTFPGRDPEDPAFLKGCEAMKLFILPKMTPEKYVVLMAIFDMDLSKFHHQNFVARMTMIIDLIMLEWCDAEGWIFISDLSGLDASIIPKLSLSAMAFYLPWFEKSVPMKLKNLVFCKSPTFMDVLINNFVKPFLSQKMYNRIIVTGDDFKVTKKLFPEELLPCDFGGQQKSSTDLNNYWLEKLKANRSWFEKTNEQIVDETKRPPDDKSTYGIEGTFRKLNVD